MVACSLRLPFKALTSKALTIFYHPSVQLCSGALMAVSIPTHVTSYWLDTTLGTVLLYFCVAAGFFYGALSTTAFFTIMEEAISERYGEGKDKKKGKLDFVHIAMPVRIVSSLGLMVRPDLPSFTDLRSSNRRLGHRFVLPDSPYPHRRRVEQLVVSRGLSSK